MGKKHSNRVSQRRLRNRVWFVKYGAAEKVPCCWCEKPLTFDDSTLEHIKDRALGGARKDMDNLDIACERCNTQRGARLSRYFGLLSQRKAAWACRVEFARLRMSLLVPRER